VYESKRIRGKVKHCFIAYLSVYRTERYDYGGEGITDWTDGFWEKASQELYRL